MSIAPCLRFAMSMLQVLSPARGSKPSALMLGTRTRARPRRRPGRSTSRTPPGSPVVIVPTSKQTTTTTSIVPVVLPIPAPTSQIPSGRTARKPRPEARPPPITSRTGTTVGFRPGIRRRRIIPPTTTTGSPTATTTTTTTPSAPRSGLPPPRLAGPGSARRTSPVDDPGHDGEEYHPKHNPGPIRLSVSSLAGQIRMPLLPLIRQDESVLHAARTAQHVRVFGGCVPFADDLCAAEFERGGQRRRAGPLDVFGAVACALVLAAHHVDGGLEGAEACWGYAFQLRDGGDAAVGCFGAGAEGEGLDLLGS